MDLCAGENIVAIIEAIFPEKTPPNKHEMSPEHARQWVQVMLPYIVYTLILHNIIIYFIGMMSACKTSDVNSILFRPKRAEF